MAAMPSLPRGWTIKSVELGSRDVADQVVDLAKAAADDRLRILVSRQPTPVEARVVDDKDGSPPNPEMIAFAADSRYW